MGHFRTVALALLLASCVTPDAPAPVAAVVAPLPKVYTCSDLKRAAAEFDALPAGAMLRVMVSDYGTQRRELAAVHGTALRCQP